jgi:hypothetical protein
MFIRIMRYVQFVVKHQSPRHEFDQSTSLSSGNNDDDDDDHYGNRYRYEWTDIATALIAQFSRGYFHRSSRHQNPHHSVFVYQSIIIS